MVCLQNMKLYLSESMGQGYTEKSVLPLTLFLVWEQ